MRAAVPNFYQILLEEALIKTLHNYALSCDDLPAYKTRQVPLIGITLYGVAREEQVTVMYTLEVMHDHSWAAWPLRSLKVSLILTF